MIPLGVVLLLAAWWALAAAMPPDTARPRRRALRGLAVAGLVASLVCFVAAIGIEQGPVFWAAVLMLSALLVAIVRALGQPGARPRGRRG